MLRLVDLFAGTGAFSLAFEQTGKVEVVFANDFSEPAKQIYEINLDHDLTLKDLNDVAVTDVPKHDILTAGFPCQPFSIAGEQAGFADARSNVFWKILDVIDHHQPQWVVLENVKNILSHDRGRTFKTICSQFEKRKYHIEYKILDTVKLSGIPQHRERMYLIACKHTENSKWILNFSVVPKYPLQDFLESGVTKNTHSKYYYTEESKIWPALAEHVTETDVVYQYRRTSVRANKSGVCPTLTANMGTGGHNVPIIRVTDGIRKLTPKECFNLQGFPSTYVLPEQMSDTKLYKLAGNAVSYPIVKQIADQIVNVFLESKK